MSEIPYHNHSRSELLDLIPKTATRILDLGCACGQLGLLLKRRQKCTIVGIELSGSACKHARKHLDFVKHADLDNFDFDDVSGKFDCIIFADILEHLIDPWSALVKASNKLEKNGVIVASIPNFCHPSVLNELARGLFRYQPAGILDFTHLRFFTRTTIFQLFAKASLKIKKFRFWVNEKNPVQYHLVAVRLTGPSCEPKATIIMTGRNLLEYTKMCIDALFEVTTYPFQLIFVDNGSNKDTLNWLRSDDRFIHIENSFNVGFPCSNNIGMEIVNTPYFVLINNDVKVTPNWLTRLIESLETSDTYVIAGPITNKISGPQQVAEYKYNSSDELHSLAEKLQKQSKDCLVEFHRIVFFCVAIRSSMLDKIGFLDEIFGMGNFEDDDYCLRATYAGYKCIYDTSVFVHHFGSLSFKHEDLDYEKLLERNEKIFMHKHKLKSIK